MPSLESMRGIFSREKKSQKEVQFLTNEQSVDRIKELFDQYGDKSRENEGAVELLTSDLSFLDSDKAWQMRDEYLNSDNKGRKALYMTLEGLAGLNSARAWELREKAFAGDDDFDKEAAISSLMGLDNDSAWRVRDELLEKRNKGERGTGLFDTCLIGLDTPRAWKMRNDLWDGQPHADKAIAGLNSDEAWKVRDLSMRELKRFIEKMTKAEDGRVKENCLQICRTMAQDIFQSLMGLDDDRAWKMRDEAHKVDIWGTLLVSLVGCDSERAWKIRDEKLAKGEHLPSIARSLAGLDSSRAWQMRDDLVSKGLDPAFLGGSINGDPVSATVWHKKIEKQQAGKGGKK